MNDRSGVDGPRVASCDRCGRPTALALIEGGGHGPRYLCLTCLRGFRPCASCAGTGMVRDLDGFATPCAPCDGYGLVDLTAPNPTENE